MSEPRRSWWDRNWKWFVPTGCLTLLLLAAAFVAAITFGVFSMMKGSDVYQQAVAQARANPAVVQALGTPIEEGFLVSGNLQTSGPSGSAELSVPLSGPRGKGTLYLEAERSAGLWTYSLLVLEAPDGTRIDLLAKDAATPKDVDGTNEPDVDSDVDPNLKSERAPMRSDDAESDVEVPAG